MQSTIKDHENETLTNKEPELNFEEMVIFAENSADDLEACDAGGSEGAGDS